MITLLFGAGASFGSGRCHPSQPPLGDHLFPELLKLNGAFASLTDSQKEIFCKQGFEAGMATIANDSRIINLLQKELACYISGFVIQPENAYSKLFGKIKSAASNIAIATLNYDLLIEQGLARNQIPFNYNGEKGSLSLLKIHGSSNFLPQLGTLTLNGNVMRNCGTFIEGLPTNAASTNEEIKRWCNDPKNGDISPILSMYARDKRVVINRGLTERIQHIYSDSIHASSHIVIVGAKYIQHDHHVWGPIENSIAQILLVDPFPTATVEWAQSVGIKNIKIELMSFSESVRSIFKFIREAANAWEFRGQDT